MSNKLNQSQGDIDSLLGEALDAPGSVLPPPKSPATYYISIQSTNSTKVAGGGGGGGGGGESSSLPLSQSSVSSASASASSEAMSASRGDFFVDNLSSMDSIASNYSKKEDLMKAIILREDLLR